MREKVSYHITPVERTIYTFENHNDHFIFCHLLIIWKEKYNFKNKKVLIEYFHDGLTWEKCFANEKVPFPQMTMGSFSEKKIIWQDLAQLQLKTGFQWAQFFPKVLKKKIWHHWNSILGHNWAKSCQVIFFSEKGTHSHLWKA